MQFFIGLHHPSDVRHFAAVFLSVNTLRGDKGRRAAFAVPAAQLGLFGGSVACDWILDSAAYTELWLHGRYRHPPEFYAREIMRWREVGNLLAVVAQDWMCEPHIIARTGLSVAEHQRRTIERYDALLAALPCGAPYVLPVLQGYAPGDYAQHVRDYGARLGFGAWVGVGSVCKRNGKPEKVLAVLEAIRAVRPDLALHGFGIKLTSLRVPAIRAALATADSMAWSHHERKNGRNPNDWRRAKAYAARVATVLAG